MTGIEKLMFSNVINLFRALPPEERAARAQDIAATVRENSPEDAAMLRAFAQAVVTALDAPA